MADNSPINFKALQIANEQRNAYGLRVNDFARYRKHCANRTHRIRSTLKMTHGKGRDFKKLPPITLQNIKEGNMHLLLLETERAWAFSQDLLTSSLQPSNEDTASTLRHSATGRFRRAVNWAMQLLSHCQSLFKASRLSAENLLEVTIYTLILNGRFLRHRDEFEDSLVQLTVARDLLDKLADAALTSRDQALAVVFADEIGPEIRYCAHELGRAKAYDVDSIVADLAPKHRDEIVEGHAALLSKLKEELKTAGKGDTRKKLDTLMWEGQPVPVRNPELVDVLLRVQEAELKLGGKEKSERKQARSSKKGVAAYDAILLALSDAEDVARRLAEAQQSSSSSSGSSASGTRDMHFVHAYVVYQLLSRRIQRDLLLVDALFSSSQQSPASRRPVKPSAKKEQVDARLYPAIVKLLDTVLQSLNQMRTLSIVDDSPDLASAVDARLSFTKARRCLYLARCYVPVKRYAEALTLIQHANIHLRETRASLSLFSADPISESTLCYYSLGPTDLTTLEEDLASDGLRFKKDWFTYNGGAVTSDNKSYKKPLFFDIALNYVELDMDRLQERAGKKPVEPAPTLSTSNTQAAEKKQIAKAKVEEQIERAVTPEPQAPARSGLSSLLGGWWGRT